MSLKKMNLKFWKKTSSISLLITTLALLSGCSDDTPFYSVDNTLNRYLQKFIAEAAARGITINPEQTGLILKFGSLDGETAGRTYYESPVRVVIDKTYWAAIRLKADSAELCEDLVFHELGHALLNRGHNNDYLSNGDWKTIMCGGTVKDNRSWNINFRSIRKEYYLNELFKTSTPEPDWATKVYSGTTDNDTIMTSDDFSFNNGAWYIKDTTTYSGNISGGFYTFQNKTKAPVLLPRSKRINFRTDADFYIETRVKLTSTSTSDQTGLVFGSADTPITVGYYTFDNNSRMFMGNSECYGWYTELIKSQLIANDFNTIGLRKVGNELYYFINGTCVYYDYMTVNSLGYDYGFEVPAKTTLSVDYFYAYTTKSSVRSASILTQKEVNPLPFVNKSKAIRRDR